MRTLIAFFGILLIVAGLLIGVGGFAGFMLISLGTRAATFNVSAGLFAGGIAVATGGVFLLIRNWQHMSLLGKKILGAGIMFCIGSFFGYLLFYFTDTEPATHLLLAALCICGFAGVPACLFASHESKNYSIT